MPGTYKVSALRKIELGAERVNSTSYLDSAFTPTTLETRAMKLPVLFCAKDFDQLHSTSSAVSSFPYGLFIPSRSLKTHVFPSSEIFQLSAR